MPTENYNYICQVPVQWASSIVIRNISIGIPLCDNMTKESRLTILCCNMCCLQPEPVWKLMFQKCWTLAFAGATKLDWINITKMNVIWNEMTEHALVVECNPIGNNARVGPIISFSESLTSRKIMFYQFQRHWLSVQNNSAQIKTLRAD